MSCLTVKYMNDLWYYDFLMYNLFLYLIIARYRNELLLQVQGNNLHCE